MDNKLLLNAEQINIILNRLTCQLLENHGDFSNTVLIAIQPRGGYVLDRIITILTRQYQIKNIQSGHLDITFYRDDFRRREEPLQANTTSINVVLEGKKVVLIDDVLFTGRSVRAALTAIESYGRPSLIELLVLIDRRFSRSLPIQPTYKGKQVDAFNDEKVRVYWKESNQEDAVYVMQNLTNL